MPIVPDTKNWTWVLEKPCPDCGYDSTATAFDEIPGYIRENVAAFRQVLSGEGLTMRPDDSTWSPLEYSAHVRDVYRIMLARLELMLVLVDPQFPNWNQDATAIEQHYNAQDPAVVADELATAGIAFADTLAQVHSGELGRMGFRGDGSAFTVESLAKYALHDPIHHLWDVTK